MKIGFIDWGGGQASLYTFTKKSGVLTLDNKNSVETGVNLDQKSLAGLKESKLHDIYLSLPRELISFRELDFPFSDEKKISDIITFELEGLLLGNAEDYVIDHIITESFEERTRVLAACVEKAKLREAINAFASAGLEPKVITSLELRIFGNDYERVLTEDAADGDKRVEAAKDEIAEPSIDLRRGELSFTGDIESFIKVSNVTAFLILILLIIFGVNATVKYNLLKKEKLLLEAEAEKSFRSLFPEDAKIIDVSRQLEGNVNILKKKKEVLGGVAVLDIMSGITDLSDNLAVLDEIRADSTNIIIKGTSATFKDVESLKEALSARFDNVSVTESSSTIDKKVSFAIVMKGRGV
ncbi:MAG: hypothetical protein HY809_08805 [Nitrospirae bacterium]|nr:hypothetical protein [Nitrospirota bacterium]